MFLDSKLHFDEHIKGTLDQTSKYLVSLASSEIFSQDHLARPLDH